MDPAPRPFSELPADPELGVPVPFACGTAGFGGPRDGSAPSVRSLDGRRVTQCALSRVCGVCGAGLGRPIAFLGSRLEADRNAFHFPPAHLSCAESLLDAVRGLTGGVLGQEEDVRSWTIVTTAGFEYVRPGKEDLDRRPTFQPNSVLTG
ncbi:hypothetical protein [Nocardioides panaciterrulae]|uniref:Uncharacterized protein n=1 Tax=Nocardioides panaciterrulae TaxID=661492 RepID=A0A7Y9JDB5_9ACTN|nr:hypothetical protein [Nocardioides panaciterrulae]NYD43104.1 hypothetical protein [Nocardioides panaciterrulae]